jgi:hypothetical protein
MIEIVSSPAPQLGSLLPLVVRPHRSHSPKDAPADSPEHGRREQYHPMTGKEHPIATLYPSKSSLMVIAITRKQTLATLKSP